MGSHRAASKGLLETLLRGAICIPGSRRDSEPWGRLGGCWHIKMIKSGTGMCAAYFPLQKSNFQGCLLRAPPALTLQEVLRDCSVKWA